MALPLPLSSPPPRTGRRYLRTPVPLFFPEEELMPEGRWHRIATEKLAQSVEHALSRQVLVSSDQFLYWDPTNPKRCLAPDVALRLGAPSELLSTWKTWERGAPHVGVEVVSPSDASDLRLEEKLERYRQAGVAEVVRYDHDAVEQPIRIWDLLDGDLVERDLSDPEGLRCDALGFYWCVYPDPELGATLRLTRDREGRDLVMTPGEADRAKLVLEQAKVEAERSAKEAALTRIAELEAELHRKR
jgi:Uma2 family endonuclease